METTTRPLCDIANDIAQHWPRVNYAARPYLDAMFRLGHIDDVYGMDSAADIVQRFLGNATSWRGEDARRIKAELKAMLR